MKEESRERIIAELRTFAATSKIVRHNITILHKDEINKRDEVMLDELETKMIDVEMAIKRFTQ